MVLDITLSLLVMRFDIIGSWVLPKTVEHVVDPLAHQNRTIS